MFTGFRNFRCRALFFTESMKHFMETKDNEQFSAPQDKPKPNSHKPQLPGDEREANIRKGAAEEDQLERLKPDDEDDKAPNKLGNPPSTTVNQGD